MQKWNKSKINVAFLQTTNFILKSEIPISVLMHTFDRLRIEHTTKLYARYPKRNKMHWSLNISLPI